MSKAYKIWPVAEGYEVVDAETLESVGPAMDKRAAMRLAFEYTITGLPKKEEPKSVVESKPVKKVGRAKKKAE